jgi:hypothetical protein
MAHMMTNLNSPVEVVNYLDWEKKTVVSLRMKGGSVVLTLAEAKQIAAEIMAIEENVQEAA